MKTRKINKAMLTKPSQFKDHTDFRLWIEFYASESERNEIVRAVNSHEELLAALKDLLCQVETNGERDGFVTGKASYAITKAEAH